MAEIKIERRRTRALPLLLAVLALVLGLLMLASRRGVHTSVSAGAVDTRNDTSAAAAGRGGTPR